ncbi:MAG: hypothetical protein WBA63_13040 [Thermomicrobiales bacterium]
MTSVMRHHAGVTMRASVITAALVLLACVPALAGSMPAATPTANTNKTPVLAYYYIWYTPASWGRAKTDLPLLGAYASDDEEVMRQQIRWAKAAGIDGFLVSWKNTTALSGRLEQLVRIAHEESFKLAINYEGLNFSRNPLPIDQVAADFAYFSTTYGNDPVFDLFGKPLIVWAGTWKFNRAEIAQVTEPYRDRLLVLASQKQIPAYEEIADLVDGNAYYWSSVDPATYPDYPGKLQGMSDAVHEHHGLWIAPAAPGFDARHLGGQREVTRDDGAMLETQLHAALSSDPDAIGLISWNEFSENSHIEPSCTYGDTYLNLLARFLGGTQTAVTIPCDEEALAAARAGTMTGVRIAPTVPVATPLAQMNSDPTFDWDSSAPEGTTAAGPRVNTIVLLAPFAVLMSASVLIVVWRSLHGRGSTADPGSDLMLPPGDAPDHPEGPQS